MPPQLVALTEGPDILLDKPILLVGRHQECDILIPSRKISRRHCLIAQVNDYLVVRDLFSTNGIRVNGIRVKEGSLRAGDELTIGNFRYEVRLNGMPSPPPTPNPGPAAAKQAPPLPVFEDPRFESCEIPVALSDPPGLLGPPPVGGPSPLLPKNRSSYPPASDPPVPGDKKAVIPDKLDLAPLSGEINPRPNKPAQ
jgi:hypothetical protein